MTAFVEAAMSDPGGWRYQLRGFLELIEYPNGDDVARELLYLRVPSTIAEINKHVLVLANFPDWPVTIEVEARMERLSGKRIEWEVVANGLLEILVRWELGAWAAAQFGGGYDKEGIRRLRRLYDRGNAGCKSATRICDAWKQLSRSDTKPPKGWIEETTGAKCGCNCS